MAKRGDIRIGVSGWTYKGWRGAFYPRGLRQADELGYAAHRFNALEINGTFYGMQTPRAFAAWRDATPGGFTFAVKGPRYITHMLKLKGVETALANFFASGPLALGDRLGPVLWQLPPFLRFDEARIAAFLELLPRDTAAAVALGRRHDDRLRAPACLEPGPVRPMRHALEIRHDSYRDARFIALLRRHGVALVVADTVEWPLLMDLTAGFVYCRLHGSVELYNSGYTDGELDAWAARLDAWGRGAADDRWQFRARTARRWPTTRRLPLFRQYRQTEGSGRRAGSHAATRHWLGRWDVTGRIRTGIAGWVFKDWRGGVFYPEGLKQRDELSYASRHLTTLEINATFYAHQKAASFAGWAAETPEDFVFPVKGHQGITHIKRLKQVETPLANFFASGVLALGRRLGPFVWQLPGNMKYDAERIQTFLALLPKDPDALLALARRHDEKTAQPFLDLSGIERVRHAIEVRHESFAEPGFIQLLRAHGVALVVADTEGWPTCDATAEFIYCRLQGAPGAEHYTEADLDGWATSVRNWAEGRPQPGMALLAAPEAAPPPRDVFVHFVSTDKANAPRNAMALAARLGVSPG